MTLISFRKRRIDRKITDTSNNISVHIVNDINTKTNPSIIDYLISKGKSEDGVAQYLGVDVTNLGSYDGEPGHRTEVAIGLMACGIGAGDVDVEENDFAEV